MTVVVSDIATRQRDATVEISYSATINTPAFDNSDEIDEVDIVGNPDGFEDEDFGFGPGWFVGGTFYDTKNDIYYEEITYTVVASGWSGPCPVDGDDMGSTSPADPAPSFIVEEGDDPNQTAACSFCSTANHQDVRTEVVYSQWADPSNDTPLKVGAGFFIDEDFDPDPMNMTTGCGSDIDKPPFDPTDTDSVFLDYFTYCDTPCCQSVNCQGSSVHHYTWNNGSPLMTADAFWSCSGSGQVPR